MTMAALVEVGNLFKKYGPVEAVRGVSFEIASGEIFGLLGPNGAGKTSTLECVIGLRSPDGGTIRLCGIDALAQPREVKERIGVVLQSTTLQDKITPREALRLFGAFYKKKVDPVALLTRFALRDKADSPFESLSGGQKQRLALALAFVNAPDVLFLDEPTVGLDAQARRELHDSILASKEEGRAVFLTTHNMEEAQLLCDRLAVIDHGIIIAMGTPDELIAQSRAIPRIVLRSARPVNLSEVLKLKTISDSVASGVTTEIKTEAVGRAIAELARYLEAEGNELLDLKVMKPSLEDVFIELTGSSLRD